MSVLWKNDTIFCIETFAAALSINNLELLILLYTITYLDITDWADVLACHTTVIASEIGILEKLGLDVKKCVHFLPKKNKFKGLKRIRFHTCITEAAVGHARETNFVGLKKKRLK